MTTTIWARTLAALTGLGLPLAANRMVMDTGEALPEAFIVYTLITAPPEQFADDDITVRSYTMQVSYYNRAGLVAMPDIDAAMMAAGFMPGPFRELPFSQESQHYGLALDYTYTEGV